MAVYRTIQISFWQDGFILSLTPEEKYFYIYLMTNTKTTQCGIYELPKPIVCLETGYSLEIVDKLLSKFDKCGKIKYCNETKEIILINWIKHNPINSVNIEKCVLKELKGVKSSELLTIFKGVNKGLVRGLSTPTKKEEEEEEEEKEKEERDSKTLTDLSAEPMLATPFQDILDLFNSNCTTLPKVKNLTDKRKKKMRIRWRKYGDLEKYQDLFKKAELSDFLSGRNGKWTGCSFDWLLEEANMVKVLEGNFDNKASPSLGKRDMSDKYKDIYMG